MLGTPCPVLVSLPPQILPNTHKWLPSGISTLPSACMGGAQSIPIFLPALSPMMHPHIAYPEAVTRPMNQLTVPAHPPWFPIILAGGQQASTKGPAVHPAMCGIGFATPGTRVSTWKWVHFKGKVNRHGQVDNLGDRSNRCEAAQEAPPEMISYSYAAGEMTIGEVSGAIIQLTGLAALAQNNMPGQ
ncbi:hypothetical protein DSO57_1025722 [Entomophthora muscae]|uniref:Uncharacterized protein n=1 Tax=Entomophthora muscae TaxID=34485 RepID=A0ACC2UNC3_9FUNG|nr:hypothetical protein DSO57_1025722 [Entomophthora muscae]